MLNFWNDSVWSKVIATGIISIISLLFKIFWKKLQKLFRKIFSQRIHKNYIDSYFNNSFFVDLFIKNYSLDIYQKIHGHKQEYINLIEQLKNDGLITFDKNGLFKLSPKGNKMITKYLN